MEKAKKAALAAAYGAGTLAAVVLLFLAAAGPGCVLFQGAMLPMELRELASAWLAIGFLPMLLVSMSLYKAVRRWILFVPAGICLLALLFWVGVWTVGMFHSPAMASGGDIILPEPEKIGLVRLTGSELDVATADGDFIIRLLRYLSQAENTGRPSVQDVPDQEAGMIRIDFNFRQGGSSRLFLYRCDSGLAVEQPYRGIYRVDDGLEGWLRQRITRDLALTY